MREKDNYYYSQPEVWSCPAMYIGQTTTTIQADSTQVGVIKILWSSKK